MKNSVTDKNKQSFLINLLILSPKTFRGHEEEIRSILKTQDFELYNYDKFLTHIRSIHIKFSIDFYRGFLEKFKLRILNTDKLPLSIESLIIAISIFTENNYKSNDPVIIKLLHLLKNYSLVRTVDNQMSVLQVMKHVDIDDNEKTDFYKKHFLPILQ